MIFFIIFINIILYSTSILNVKLIDNSLPSISVRYWNDSLPLACSIAILTRFYRDTLAQHVYRSNNRIQFINEWSRIFQYFWPILEYLLHSIYFLFLSLLLIYYYHVCSFHFLLRETCFLWWGNSVKLMSNGGKRSRSMELRESILYMNLLFALATFMPRAIKIQ